MIPLVNWGRLLRNNRMCFYCRDEVFVLNFFVSWRTLQLWHGASRWHLVLNDSKAKIMSGTVMVVASCGVSSIPGRGGHFSENLRLLEEIVSELKDWLHFLGSCLFFHSCIWYALVETTLFVLSIDNNFLCLLLCYLHGLLVSFINWCLIRGCDTFGHGDNYRDWASDLLEQRTLYLSALHEPFDGRRSWVLLGFIQIIVSLFAVKAGSLLPASSGRKKATLGQAERGNFLWRKGLL